MSDNQLIEYMQNIREPMHVLKNKIEDTMQIISHADYQAQSHLDGFKYCEHLAVLPAIYPELLGDRTFLTTYQLRFPYLVGEMANGIATAQMVIAAAKAGMLGFFGAAGLLPTVIEQNILMIKEALKDSGESWGCNLIHSPHERHIEEATVDLLLHHDVRIVSASAFLALTPSIVRYLCHGLTTDENGKIIRRNHIIAKVSRPEIARQFMSPPPTKIVEQLLNAGKITANEARLAALIPVADDITVEADSGGHTDNRPLTVLFPTIFNLAREVEQQFSYQTSLRVGAAGGLGAPTAVAAAFSMGAAYVLTGSINQAAIESGLAVDAKEMLLKADLADVAMAPAADMFEMGVKLQVLKRGTLFSSRASKLYDLYTRFDSLESIPLEEKRQLELQIFGDSLENVWNSTQRFFDERDPKQILNAEQNPKVKMALVFRSYLGLSSRWAIQGNSERRADYQIWCGPAMGAFNAWVKGGFLEALQERTVEQIGRNLLEGAAVITRAQQLRSLGFPLPLAAFTFRPRNLI